MMMDEAEAEPAAPEPEAVVPVEPKPKPKRLVFSKAAAAGLAAADRHSENDPILKVMCRWGHAQSSTDWNDSSPDWADEISIDVPATAALPITVSVLVVDDDFAVAALHRRRRDARPSTAATPVC